MATMLETIHKIRESSKVVEADKKDILINSMVRLSEKVIGTFQDIKDIPESLEKGVLPQVETQLKAAEKRTETAVDDIMNAAENALAALSKVEGAGKPEIEKAVNAIFEASCFQDLMAQHLNEVKLLINNFEHELKYMRESIEYLESDSMKEKPVRKKALERSDQHLLNGPATDF